MYKKEAFILALLFMTICSEAASSVKENFKSALKAEESGDYEKSLRLYNKIIERHPKRTKSILRAYDHILHIYKNEGETKEYKELLSYMKKNFPSDLFDLKDIAKLSAVYSKNGEVEEALRLQWHLVNNPYSPTYRKTIIKTYSRLLDYYSAKGDQKQVSDLFKKFEAMPDSDLDVKDRYQIASFHLDYGNKKKAIAILENITRKYSDAASPQKVFLDRKTVIRTYSNLLDYYSTEEDQKQVSRLIKKLEAVPDNVLDDKDQYKVALLHLNYGNKEKAITLLQGLVQRSPDTVHSKKALFVLAAESYARKDYESSIEYYSRYIEKYPENTFYVQKAYQRIVDCRLAMGETELSKELMKRIADQINGVSDYRSGLNLAIDLKFKGLDKLAEATFKNGYTAAMKIIQEEPEKYDALKAYLEILRAAHAMVKFDIAEESARAILSDFNHLGGDERLNKSVGFIKSQAYLWLARIYKEDEQYEKTIKILEDFIDLYPDSKDRDYAILELAETYENNGAYAKAKGLYKTIQTEPFKNRAEEQSAILK